MAVTVNSALATQERWLQREIKKRDEKIKELEVKLDEMRNAKNNLRRDYAESQSKLAIAVEVLEMVEDNTKMPHQHSDLQTRLYCLTERATEALSKIKQ